MKWSRYRKFGVALLGALVVIGTSLPPDAPEWLSGVCAMATAFGVWATPNASPPVYVPPTRYQRRGPAGGYPSDVETTPPPPPPYNRGS